MILRRIAKHPISPSVIRELAISLIGSSCLESICDMDGRVSCSEELTSTDETEELLAAGGLGGVFPDSRRGCFEKCKTSSTGVNRVFHEITENNYLLPLFAS